MSLENKQVAYNVIHLIYPLRKINSEKKDNLGSSWRQILINNDAENQRYFYSSIYNNKKIGLIPSEEVIKYFHPSVHKVLFSKEDDLTMKAYRYVGEMEHNTFTGHIFRKNHDVEMVRFQWLSTEVYQFMEISFLVVRLSMLENQFRSEHGGWETREATRSIDTWIRFVNRVRMIYPKHSNQEVMYVEPDMSEDNQCVDTSPKPCIFFNYIKQFTDQDHWLGENYIIASRSFSHKKGERKNKQLTRSKIENQHDKHNLREPVSFVHGFVTQYEPSMWTKKELWNIEEIYQVLSIDSYEGESGGTQQFREDFVNQHVYNRWANYGTYYTGIDYGALTMTTDSQKWYQNRTDDESFVLFYNYQHHCKHYLILTLLQLYYREELQEIMGSFSRLPRFTDSTIKESEILSEAEKVLNRYYNLNQYFIFDRLTNEIQGMELWRFYEKIFESRLLYKSVQEDMKELNQRMIEYSNRKQSRQITLLTVLAGLTGMMGMNQIIDGDMNWGNSKLSEYIDIFFKTVAFDLVLILILFTVCSIIKVDISNFKWFNKNRWAFILVIFLFSCLTYFIFYYIGTNSFIDLLNYIKSFDSIF